MSASANSYAVFLPFPFEEEGSSLTSVLDISLLSCSSSELLFCGSSVSGVGGFGGGGDC